MANLDKFDPEHIDDEEEYEDLSDGERHAAEAEMIKRDKEEGRFKEKVLSLKRKPSESEGSESEDEAVPEPKGDRGDSKIQTTLFSFFTKKSKPNAEGETVAPTTVSLSVLKAQAKAQAQANLIKKPKKGGKSGIAPGSLVWAKLTGYPWWPALVCIHPDEERSERKSQGIVEIFVQFLGEPFTDWVERNLVRLWGEDVDRSEGEQDKAWREGVKVAEGAVGWSEEKRLAVLIENIDDEEEHENLSGGDRQAAEAEMLKRDKKEGRFKEKVLSLKRKPSESEGSGSEGSESEAEPEPKRKKGDSKKQTKPAIAAGTLVWAKLAGYPWWPALVCSRKPTEERVERKSQGVVEIHVLFLGEDNRDWVARSLVKLWGEDVDRTGGEKDDAWKDGVKAAEEAVDWSEEKRLSVLLKTEDEDGSEDEEEEGPDSPEKKVKSPPKKRRRIVMPESDDSESEAETYEVEKILEKREEDGAIEYLIKWEGYDKEEDNTWEPKKNLDCTEKIKLFEASLEGEGKDSKSLDEPSKDAIKLTKDDTEDKEQSAGAC